MQGSPGQSLPNPSDSYSSGVLPDAAEQVWSGRLFRFVVIVFALNVVSAALFIGMVNRQVYDEPYNIFDVHNYATRGLSMETLLSHRNPPGPTGFLWMAAGVRLRGGNELRDARIAILMSWIFLAGGILLGARYSRFPELWYGALAVTLVFPHSVEAAATLLTEGPSLLFALLGSLAWTEYVSRPESAFRTTLLGMLGGLSMGMAVTCRQYNLALLPAAAALFVFYYWRRPAIVKNTSSTLGAIFSLTLAALPVFLMVLTWKGISSPGMASGVSYDQMWKATVGLNLTRPLIVAFYAAVYLVPLTFPAMYRMKASHRLWATLVAAAGGDIISHIYPLFLQPGPLNSLIRFSSRVPYGATTLSLVIAMVAIYNAISVCSLLWEQRQVLSVCAPAVFALLVVVFFVAEQIGVGGNLPFYDRYVLQLAPFLGLIAFAILPRLTPVRVLALAAMSVLSHVMLWRYAFGG
jgi:hypothetical protein